MLKTTQPSHKPFPCGSAADKQAPTIAGQIFSGGRGRQTLQSCLPVFKILASGWPCRKGPWRKAQKNQAQLSSHPSRRATGQELTGVRRWFPGDLLPLLTKLISETSALASSPRTRLRGSARQRAMEERRMLLRALGRGFTNIKNLTAT